MATSTTTPPARSRTRLGKLADRHRRILAGSALVLITLAAYWPALGAGFIWDDDAHVTNNTLLHYWPGLVAIWSVIGAVPQYYPVTHTTFWIEYHLWGLHPLGYHLDNILLHAASAILLWGILRRLKVAGAWAIAAVFAIHPLQVESVAWVTERKNVLSGLFFLLALWTYLSFAWPEFIGRGPRRTRRSPWKYLASMSLFILALLSKSVTGTLPGVVLVLTWWKRGRLTRRDVIPLLPFFALAMAMGSLTGWIEKHLVGADGPEYALALWQRIGIAARAICFYAWKFLVPAHLTFIYPRWNVGPSAWPALLLFPIGVAGALVALWLLRRRVGRGPLAASLLFVGMLFPALGFVNVYPMRYSFVADHFQYLACIAMSALTVGSAAYLLPRRAKLPVAAIVLITLGTLSWIHAKAFHNPRTLWRDVLSKNPDCWMAHNNYGNILDTDGNIGGAEQQYLDALRINPASVDALMNMAQVYRHRHDYAGAEAWFERALAAVPLNSPVPATQSRTEIWSDLGAIYDESAKGAANSPQHAKSVQAYRQALVVSPDDETALLGLGHELAEQGNMSGAMASYSQAVRNNPDSIPAHYDLGNAYFAVHDWLDAQMQFQTVIRLDPRNFNAHNNLGSALAAQGQWDQAISEFRMALSVDPSSALAAKNLRRAIDEAGRSGGAH